MKRKKEIKEMRKLYKKMKKFFKTLSPKQKEQFVGMLADDFRGLFLEVVGRWKETKWKH